MMPREKTASNQINKFRNLRRFPNIERAPDLHSEREARKEEREREGFWCEGRVNLETLDSERGGCRQLVFRFLFLG